MPTITKVETRRHIFSEKPGVVHYIVSVSPIPADANMDDVDFLIASKIKGALVGESLDD